VCPLCDRVVTQKELEADPQLLSVEHVPPKAVHGRRLCLTCRDCNIWAGHTLDSELARYERITHFSAGISLHPELARFTWDNVTLNIRVRKEGDRFTSFSVESANNPVFLDKLRQDLSASAESALSAPIRAHLELSIRADVRRTYVSLLRSAYLIGFARLGYAFAFSKSMKIVKEQIRNPDDLLIEQWSLYGPREAATARTMVIIREPEEIRSLGVALGRQLILFPITSDDLGFYPRLVEYLRSQGTALLKPVGDWYSLPSEPVYEFDFQLPDRDQRGEV
jgi:hypothetical protein